VTGARRHIEWLVVWVLTWLVVGETLYQVAGWDKTLAGFVGIVVATAAAQVFDRWRGAAHGSGEVNL
jgi:4-hydroxybenzoate polyprenyltransferase